MKRNIPRTRASTRELWCAAGGCSAWSCATACASTSPRPPRADDQEAGGRAGGALLDAIEERPSDDGLVGDDEDVHLALRLGRGVDDDVLDRQVARRVANPIDDVAAQPPRLLLRMGRDDD